jgi:non-heme chloroperoxidase
MRPTGWSAPALATDVTLHYAEQGDRAGEAIIYLHGYSDSWYSFSRALP